MKIGKYIQQSVQLIFDKCDDKEFKSLLDLQYSRDTFQIGFPFCIEINLLEPKNSKRYWAEEYIYRDKHIRVCSQWYERHRLIFNEYLKSKKIKSGDVNGYTKTYPTTSTSNRRYKDYSIGNAQNLFIRNILGKIGHESFNEDDWGFTKDYFASQCAYCGAETNLVIDHAIPINKDQMGEHRLGNIVPSCKSCNDKKHNKDFRAFLSGNSEAINRIEEYMASKNYNPLSGDESLKMILDMAYKEVADLANRYVAIINGRVLSSNKDTTHI